MPKYVQIRKDAYHSAMVANDIIGCYMLLAELENMGLKPYPFDMPTHP
jgi:uncharacterized Fe-S cluster-containing radical SAM superfamily protein